MKIGSFRFHFYADEGNEPPHIHVATPDGECKFWLQPVRLAKNIGVFLWGNIILSFRKKVL
ncbi:MAG: DUF4160 domain-containing protein [candidate division Zixibacteria bacterium]|nr:DUF4160 domain-containing protein [candidate division Zixibacteria bacterium]